MAVFPFRQVSQKNGRSIKTMACILAPGWPQVGPERVEKVGKNGNTFSRISEGTFGSFPILTGFPK